MVKPVRKRSLFHILIAFDSVYSCDCERESGTAGGVHLHFDILYAEADGKRAKIHEKGVIDASMSMADLEKGSASQ